MPLYTYRCKNGHEFDRIVANSDVIQTQCDKCSNMAEKQISSFAGYVVKGDNSGSTRKRRR